MNKQLINMTSKEMIELFSSESDTAGIINRVDEKAQELMKDQDVTTDEGRKKIASDAAKISSMKTALLKAKLQSTVRYRNIIKKVNASGNIIESELDQIRDKVKKPLTDYREHKASQVDMTLNCNGTIMELSSPVDNEKDDKSLPQLKEDLQKLVMLEIDVDFLGALSEDVQKNKKDSIKKLESLIATKEEAEKNRILLEKLQAEKAEREAKEAEEAEANRIKEEAKKQALKEAQDKIDQDKKEAQDKIDAEAKEASDKIIAEENRLKEMADKLKADQKKMTDQEEKNRRDEAKRIQDIKDAEAKKEKEDQEALEKAEAEKQRLANDRLHIASILTPIKKEFMKAGISEEQAKIIIFKIMRNEIPNISINFSGE